MRKLVLILAGCALAACAQESAFQEIDARGKQDSFRESLSIREVRESSAKDVGEALVKVDGLWRIRKGGIANDVVLRGFQQDNINVTVDGARIYGACPNNMDPPAFHVDFAEIQEVEVTKGAFDVRNQGSLGGMVNVVSKKPEQGFRVVPNFAAGSFGYLNPSITGSYAGDGGYAGAGYSFRRSEPYRDGRGARITERSNFRPDAIGDDAFRIGTAWLKSGFAPREGQQFDAGYTRQMGGAVLYPYLQMDALYDNADRANASYRIRKLGAFENVRVESYFTRVKHWMTDELRLSSVGAMRPYGMAAFASTKAFGGRAEAGLAGIVFGVEAYRRNWNGVNTMRMSGMYMDQASIPDVNLTDVGGYADYTRMLGTRVRLNSGARLDHARSEARSASVNTNLYWAYKNTRALEATDVVPAANARVAVTLTSRIEAFAGIGYTTRLPDPQERFFNLKRAGSDWVGNPELKPSRNTEGDAGITIRVRKLYLRPTLFYSRIDDYIAIHNQPRVNMAPGVMNLAARSFANVPGRMRGGELGYNLGLSDRLAVFGGFSYARGTKAANPALRIFDTDMAEMPPFKARTSVRYGTRRFFAEVETIGAWKQGRVDTDLREDPTAAYGIVNAKTGVHLKKLSVSVAVDNLTDHFYYEAFSYQRDPFRLGTKVPEPGRSVWVNISHRF